MEKSTIIELSRWTASDTISNAQWTNNLSVPTVINNGDIITVRNSYIDTTLTTTSSIEILEDVELTLNFIYYINNTGIGIYYVILGSKDNIPEPVFINTFSEPKKLNPPYQLNGPDGLPYVLVYDLPSNPALNGKPVIETVYINIPKNIYSQNALAQLITTQLELVNIQPTNQIMSSVSQLFTNGIVSPESSSDGTFFQFTKPIEKPDPSKVITTIQKQLYYGICMGNGTERLKQTLFFYDSNNNLVACKLVPMTDNQNYCDISHLPAYTIISPIMTFPEENQVLPLVQFESQPYFLRDAGFIGAAEFSITYDPNANRFNIEYMHTPIIQNNNEVCMTFTNQIGYVSPGNPLQKRISYHTAMGGIMLVNAYTNTSYNPLEIVEVPFLTQLGFKLNDLIDIEDLYTVFNGNNNMLNSTYNKFKYTNFLKYTTRNYAPLSMLSSQSTMAIPSTRDNTDYTMNINPSMFYNTYDDSNTGDYKVNGSGFSVVDSNITIKIIASSNSKSSNENTGHFLLSLSSYPSNYINSEKQFNIHSVIGTYYLSPGSFCENAYEPNIYVHNGESIAISKMEIAILNPYTKRPASNLGQNSSIYLEITNNLQNQQQPQKK